MADSKQKQTTNRQGLGDKRYKFKGFRVYYIERANGEGLRPVQCSFSSSMVRVYHSRLWPLKRTFDEQQIDVHELNKIEYIHLYLNLFIHLFIHLVIEISGLTLMSMPLAATSVQTRNRASPDLKC